jgi:hypothetical protein
MDVLLWYEQILDKAEKDPDSVIGSFTSVPRGTFITKSSAFLPRWRFPRPFSPRGAEYFLLYLKSARVEMLVSA